MQELGTKERLKYKDISWLMPSVDVESVLANLNCDISSRSGHIVRAYCPDHHLFVGRRPSHPHWVVNTETGETFCFTEGRGSNLVWIICRLFDCHPKEAVKFLTGIESDVDTGFLDLTAIRHANSKLRRKEEQESEDTIVSGLNQILKDMENRYMSEMAYQFFIHPPGKTYATNIYRDTVDRYMVFERTWGYYTNRIIIPVIMKDCLVGFCAVDILGRERWLQTHPLKTKDDYKKVLYPSNFTSGESLFGYDDCEKGAGFIILVEGPREVMKLWQEGFTNTVAIFGSFLSDCQHDLIGSIFPSDIVLMFDGDDPGRETTDRVGDKLSRVFGEEHVHKRYLPEGTDPKNFDHDDFEKIIWG